MFKRRRPLTKWEKIREAGWPSMGWRRMFRYTRHRLIRLSDSTHKIAAGLAVGFSVSFSPLVGTHFIQCALICYLLRFNLIAALIGTAVGNPWTYPFIWWGSYELGVMLLEIVGASAGAGLPQDVTFSSVWQIIETQPMQIFLPWMLGAHLIALLCWFPAYFVYYYLITGARAARKKARLHRLHKVAREVTGQKT
jgi:uncharacterized protein (DUF2062 family)